MIYRMCVITYEVNITDLSFYYILFKILGLIGNPEHGNGEGQIKHHLLKIQRNKTPGE